MSKKKQNQSIIYDFNKLIFLSFIGALFLFPYYRFVLIIGLILFLITPFIFRYTRELANTKKLQKSGIREIDQMNGVQFEHYLKALFLGLGYKPTVTKASYDFGADVILNGSKQIVIQAKCYSANNNVGIDAVQQIYAAKAFYKADEAWVVTNRYFTPSATQLAGSCQVTLIDRDKLVELILSLQEKNPQQELPLKQNTQVIYECKRCGAPLTLRTGKRGSFYGCTSFPTCRHTEALQS
ncbi:restriction endonuclease [Alkalihalobacillus sp. FSL R5-0424]